ncbi:GPW/gp25 family protein [uncultured Sphingomonas sp.]|uniref:GPW/gp25 family protein n=1 Tax=uncultured Sphingomonas sp. TaxID=158754 RepID=UPI0025E51199|nr:GPW/gp25 family protein [uncultured Sphingomonas sp.]
MICMDAVTGKPMYDTAHLSQSIGDILSTPIGSRVMRRDYGSALFELVDAPGNALTRSRIYAATATALARWEPRIRLTRVTLSIDDQTWPLTIEGERTDAARPSDFVRLTIPLRPVTS